MADPDAHRILCEYESGTLGADSAIRKLVALADTLSRMCEKLKDDADSFERKYKRLKRQP